MMTLPVKAALHWTHHSRLKMRQYRLSEARVKRVLHSPTRVEEGIAPNTIAMMQPASLRTTAGVHTWKQEIWVMIQGVQSSKLKMKSDNSKSKNWRISKSPTKLKIISAWRYPGVTKPRSEHTKELLKERFREYLEEWNR